MFDIKTLKGADGKPISLEGVDAKVVAVLDAVGGAITASVESALGDGLSEKITRAIEPVTAKLAELEKKPAGDPNKPADKTGDTPDDEQPPKWAKPLFDTVNELKTARQTETEQAQTAARVKSYLDAKFPNLGKARAVVEKRLIGMGPKDDTALKAGVETIKGEFDAVGIEVAKVFDANPAAEGAKDDPKDEAERAKAEKLQALRDTGPLVKVG